MNATSRAILQTVLTSDASLSPTERRLAQILIEGKSGTEEAPVRSKDVMLVSQQEAAAMLSLNRVTIWRMVRNGSLHPIEVLPGTWRYPVQEIQSLPQQGCQEGAQPLPRAA